MKNFYIFFLFLLTLSLPAQVGINTRTPDPSAALDIFSAGKGTTFPIVSLLSKTDVTTIPNPKESMIVYNTNSTILGRTGYYFWDGAKWDYFFSDINQTNLLNQVQYYSGSSSTPLTFTRAAGQFLGYSPHAAGEALDPAQWTVIPALTKTVTVDRPQNDVLMSTTGMFQANNSSSANTSGISTSIGFFVDDKLVDVKPLFLDFQVPCSYRQYLIYGNTKNLTKGSHVVKFAIRNISSPNISGLTVTYGGPNSACSPATLSAFEAAISGTVFINQPYVF